MEHLDTIAVVDLGGQYAHLIAAKLRSQGYHAILVDPASRAEDLKRFKGVVLSGSPDRSSRDEGMAEYDRRVFDLDIPLLGLCYGHQEMAKHYGGRVEHAGMEYGPADLEVLAHDDLFAGLGEREEVWMSHGDSVTGLPEGFVELGRTIMPDGRLGRFAAIADRKRKRYGLQFHPEVDDTAHGTEILANFAGRICGCAKTWNVSEQGEALIEEIRREARGRDVLLLASGGVDSTVCAWLVSRAVGPDHLHLLHVDTGLMRSDESRQVVSWFEQAHISEHLHFVDASDRFFSALSGLVDPEAKRKVIGDLFVEVLEEEAGRIAGQDFVMAQGTIYPDTIESGGSRKAAVIKTHHNRVGLIQKMIEEGRMIEPLRDFYKTEVRELGRRLGIPQQALDRHPFPGPGLGVRVLGSSGETSDTDAVDRDELLSRAARHGFTARVLPVRSVGVKGDLRSYEHAALLIGDFDPERAARATVEIANQTRGINRCALLFGKDPGRIESIRAPMEPARVELLREADRIVHEILEAEGLVRSIWQCPVVLVPAATEQGRELVVVRPVISERAMTARPYLLPREVMETIWGEISRLEGVWGLALDVTAKPPGSIEWE